MLEKGYSFCCLYTDLANPTSNSIYQKIGYRPVADSSQIRFDQPMRTTPEEDTGVRQEEAGVEERNG
jgi:hypothetical protein